MQRGLNKVMLIGNLGADPETRYTPNGTAVCNIRIATSEFWKDRNTGEQQERTEWHRIVAFNRLAEVMGQYLRKGSKVYVEGKLQTRKWQDQQGNDRYSTEVLINEMQMLDTRSATQRGEQAGQPRGDAEGEYDQYYHGGRSDAPSQGTGGAATGGGGTPPDDFDDDIPFAFALVAPLAGLVMSLLQGTAGTVV